MSCQHFVISILLYSCSHPPIASVSFPVKQGTIPILLENSMPFQNLLATVFQLGKSVITFAYMHIMSYHFQGQKEKANKPDIIFLLFYLWKPPEKWIFIFLCASSNFECFLIFYIALYSLQFQNLLLLEVQPNVDTLFCILLKLFQSVFINR